MYYVCNILIYKEMKKFYLLYFVFLIGCNSVNISNQKESIHELDNIEITDNQDSHKVLFNIKNLNNSAVFYVKRNKLEIDKLVGGEWIRVKILPCPCGAPCREINEDIAIEPHKSISIKWSMIESWCGERTENKFVRETISQRVNQGKYRLNIIIKDKKGQKKEK